MLWVNVWMIVGFLAATLPGVPAEYVAIGERIAGEYFGMAVMRCSLVPVNTVIQFIEWREGTTSSGDMLYLYSFQKEKLYGKFKHRDITGYFTNNGSSFDLRINSTVPEDDQYYFCRIKPKGARSIVSDSVKLTLVAPPDSPPAITNMSGGEQMISNCSNEKGIPVVEVKGQQSFICRVGGSHPDPYVAWYYGWHNIVEEMVLYSRHFRHRNKYRNPGSIDVESDLILTEDEYNMTMSYLKRSAPEIKILQHSNNTMSVTYISHTYHRKGVNVKTAQQQIHFIFTENITSITLMCNIIAPKAGYGPFESKRMCLRLVKSGYNFSASEKNTGVLGHLTVLLYLCPLGVFILVMCLLNRKYGTLQKERQFTAHVLRANICFIVTFSHISIGVLAAGQSLIIQFSGSVAIGSASTDGMTDDLPAAGKYVLGAMLVYFSIRLLLNGFCIQAAIHKRKCHAVDICHHYKVSYKVVFISGPSFLFLMQMIQHKIKARQRNSEEEGQKLIESGETTIIAGNANRPYPCAKIVLLVTFVVDMIHSGLHLVGIAWAFMAGEYHWNGASFVFLMSLVYGGCVVWLLFGFFCKYRSPVSTEGKSDPWPPTKAAYNMGPVKVHIAEPAETKGMSELVFLASALASSKCKGYIKIVNTNHKAINDVIFVRWKKRVQTMLRQLIGESPGELFTFSNNRADEENFYLHVIPARTPLLVPNVFTDTWSVITTESKKHLTEKMIEMSQYHTCVVLNINGDPVILPQAHFIEKMNKTLKLVEVNKIPGFPVEEMKKYRRIETPSAECAVFSIYGVEDMIQAKPGLQIWPEKYEKHLDLGKHSTAKKTLQRVLWTVQQHYKQTKGLLYISPCIKNDVEKTSKRKQGDIICDILVITSDDMPLLLTLTFANKNVGEYSKDFLGYLDQSLSWTQPCQNECAFYVENHIISAKTLKQNDWFINLIKDMRSNRMYPDSYLSIGDEKCKSIMYSLYTSLASFVPSTYVFDKEAMDYIQTMNLMTVEQLNTLLVCQSEQAKLILLKGFAGSGKTVVAVEYAKWLRSERATMNEILYVTYSKKLAEHIENIRLPWCHPKAGESLCLAINICELLGNTDRPHAFSNVKWWILDDAQNFAFLEKRFAPQKMRGNDISKSIVHEGYYMDVIGDNSRWSTAEGLPDSPTATSHSATSVTPQRSASVTPSDPKLVTSSDSTVVMSQNTQSSQVKPGSTTKPQIKHDSTEEQRHQKRDIYKAEAPPNHWLKNLKYITSGSNIEGMLVLCDPTQALGQAGPEEMDIIEKVIAFDTNLNLKQVSRTSIEITKFICKNLIPREILDSIGWNINNTEDIVAHRYKGEKPQKQIQSSWALDDLKEMVSQQQHEWQGHLREGDLGIIIHQSVVKSEKVGSDPADADDNTEAEWGLLDDYIGIEKPIIVAVLGSNAHWSQKVAIASRARVKLYWTELQEQLCSSDLAKLFDKMNKPYIAWVTSEAPAIAVFGGTRGDTGEPLDKVIAAPIRYSGLGGNYTEVEAIPSIPNPRFNTAVAVYNRQVWVVGGVYRGTVTDECDVLDLATCQWRKGPRLQNARYAHSVTKVAGIIVTLGGRQTPSTDLNTCETLKPGTGWQGGPDLSGKRSHHAACNWNGRVYVSGGFSHGVRRSVISWKPGTDSWHIEASLPSDRWSHTMATRGQRLLVCGGIFNNSIDEYNSVSRTWTTLTTLPETKLRSDMVVYHKNLYIVGGLNSTSTWRYGSDWHEENQGLPLPIDSIVACVIDLPNTMHENILPQ